MTYTGAGFPKAPKSSQPVHQCSRSDDHRIPRTLSLFSLASLVREGPWEYAERVKATGLRRAGQGGGIGHEAITVHEVPLAEVYDWLAAKARAGILVDPKIYAGLYFLGRAKKVPIVRPDRPLVESRHAW